MAASSKNPERVDSDELLIECKSSDYIVDFQQLNEAIQGIINSFEPIADESGNLTITLQQAQEALRQTESLKVSQSFLGQKNNFIEMLKLVIARTPQANLRREHYTQLRKGIR